jgi:hypothetical protein
LSLASSRPTTITTVEHGMIVMRLIITISIIFSNIITGGQMPTNSSTRNKRRRSISNPPTSPQNPPNLPRNENLLHNSKCDYFSRQI